MIGDWPASSSFDWCACDRNHSRVFAVAELMSKSDHGSFALSIDRPPLSFFTGCLWSVCIDWKVHKWFMSWWKKKTHNNLPYTCSYIMAAEYINILPLPSQRSGLLGGNWIHNITHITSQTPVFLPSTVHVNLDVENIHAPLSAGVHRCLVPSGKAFFF